MVNLAVCAAEIMLQVAAVFMHCWCRKLREYVSATFENTSRAVAWPVGVANDHIRLLCSSCSSASVGLKDGRIWHGCRGLAAHMRLRDELSTSYAAAVLTLQIEAFLLQ